MSDYSKQDVAAALRMLAEEIHDIAVDKGWWDEPREPGTIVALCHSELSEALEAMREDKVRSDKIETHSAVAEELADTIIRILDYSQHAGLDVPGALVEKLEYNRGRDYKHGGKKF